MADDFLFVDLVGDRKLLRNIEEIPDTVRRLVAEKIRGWTEALRDQVVENIQSRLNTKTGQLARSVQVEIIQDGIRVEGRVYIAGVPYAVAQDKGAVTPAHIIRPREAKILAFIAATGDKVFATRVFHPGGVIPPTYYMRDAYRFMSPKVTRGLRYQIVEKIRNKIRGGL